MLTIRFEENGCRPLSLEVSGPRFRQGMGTARCVMFSEGGM